MKKITSLLFFVLLPFIVFSQNVKLEGTVKNETGTPLEMANVIALKKEQNFYNRIQLPTQKDITN
jgi:hypothetical protein